MLLGNSIDTAEKSKSLSESLLSAVINCQGIIENVIPQALARLNSFLRHEL
jgi:hypothetical protein